MLSCLRFLNARANSADDTVSLVFLKQISLNFVVIQKPCSTISLGSLPFKAKQILTIQIDVESVIQIWVVILSVIGNVLNDGCQHLCHVPRLEILVLCYRCHCTNEIAPRAITFVLHAQNRLIQFETLGPRKHH